MSDISDILFEANIPTLKKIFENVCNEYEKNNKYVVKKIYEDNKIVGFWVYFEELDGYRNLAEGHYMGKNPFMALRMFREMTKGAKKLRAKVQKVNERVWKRYLRIGFKVISEDYGNYILQKEVS